MEGTVGDFECGHLYGVPLSPRTREDTPADTPPTPQADPASCLCALRLGWASCVTESPQGPLPLGSQGSSARSMLVLPSFNGRRHGGCPEWARVLDGPGSSARGH